MEDIRKDLQYYKFAAYGFLKNLRFFEAFFLVYLRSRGFGYAQIGTLYALREISINLIEIPTGVLADGWGRKKTMLLSFVSYIAAFLLLYRAPSFLLLMPAMILYAFGDACRTGTHKSMIFSYLSRNGMAAQKSLYYGYTRSWSQKGSALSALLGALIVLGRGEYAPIFLYSVIPYVLDFLLILSYPSYLDRTEGPARKKKALLSESLKALRSGAVLMRVSHVSIFAGFHKAAKDYLQPILQAAALGLPFFTNYGEEKRSAALIGIVYTLIFLLSSRAARQAGRVHDHFGDRGRVLLVTLIGGGLAGIGAALFLYLNMPWFSVLVFFLIYGLQNIRKPVGIGYLGDSIDPGIQATVLSVESQGETLWTALFALVIGFCAEHISLPAALGIASSILLLSSLLFRKDRETM